MYGIFTYIWLIFMVNVGKLTLRWLEYPPFLIGNTSILNPGPFFSATAMLVDYRSVMGPT